MRVLVVESYASRNVRSASFRTWTCSAFRRRSSTAPFALYCPMKSITHSTSTSVRLVIVNGAPVYGESSTMKSLLPHAELDAVSVCGAQKLIDLSSSVAAKGMRLSEITEKLKAALAEWGSGLAPFAECH